MWLRAGRGGRGRALGPDHEQDAGGAEICCRPDRRPGMTQDLAGAAPARGRSPAVDRVGSEDHVLHTRARCAVAVPPHMPVQTAPTGGEEGGAGGRGVRGRRALVVCARSPRAGGRQVTEASGERARSTLASVCCARLSNRQVKQEKQNSESSSTTNPAVVGTSAPGAAGRAALRKAAGLPLASSRPAAP